MRYKLTMIKTLVGTVTKASYQYDPLQGRNNTQDPIGLVGGNIYNYPLNPIENIDSLGLCAEDLCIGEVGIAAYSLWQMFL